MVRALGQGTTVDQACIGDNGTGGNVAVQNPTSASTGSSTDGQPTTDEKNCYNAGLSLGWIMCPIVDLIDRTLTSLKEHIKSVLEIKSSELGLDANGKYQGTRKAWQNFARLSTVLIVIATLIMVFSTALSFGPFDNYTIKKMLPKLLIAIIMIQLSWVGLTFFIRVSNGIGSGIEGLVINSFITDVKDGSTRAVDMINFEGTSGNVVGFLGLAGIAGAALGLIAILPIAISALLGFLMAFIVLTFRKVVVIALLVVSPIAIAARAVPGLEGWFKKWWDLFSRALIMYPLVMLFLSIGAVFANIFLGSGEANDPAGGGNKILALICYFGPYFLIPLTFKFAGGLIGQLSGVINDRNKGLIDRTKKWDTERTARNRAKSRVNNRFGGDNVAARAGNFLARGLTRSPRAYVPGTYGEAKRSQYRTMATVGAADATKDLEAKNISDGDALNDFVGARGSRREIERRALQLEQQSRDRRLEASQHRANATAAAAAGNFALQADLTARAARAEKDADGFTTSANALRDMMQFAGKREYVIAAAQKVASSGRARDATFGAMNDVIEDRGVRAAIVSQMAGAAKAAGRADQGGYRLGGDGRVMTMTTNRAEVMGELAQRVSSMDQSDFSKLSNEDAKRAVAEAMSADIGTRFVSRQLANQQYGADSAEYREADSRYRRSLESLALAQQEGGFDDAEAKSIFENALRIDTDPANPTRRRVSPVFGYQSTPGAVPPPPPVPGGPPPPPAPGFVVLGGTTTSDPASTLTAMNGTIARDYEEVRAQVSRTRPTGP